ncbi:MAG TPA: response regulator [Anaerolineae bacterium]|nr:response regulator [Anaerolineae bacterium]
MTRVYLADAQPEVRSALRLLLLDLNMQVVGEAADWPIALAQASAARPDMLVVHWGLLLPEAGAALAELRVACPAVRVIVLSGQVGVRRAALASGADAFISTGEAPDRVAEHLRAVAGGAGVNGRN